MTHNTQLDALLKSLEDNHATDIRVIPVSKQTSVTDYMVVCTGRSSTHLRAAANYLLKDMKALGMACISKHGITEGDWALLDFGEFVVHIMQAQSRAFYNLEALWQESAPPLASHA